MILTAGMSADTRTLQADREVWVRVIDEMVGKRRGQQIIDRVSEQLNGSGSVSLRVTLTRADADRVMRIDLV